MALATCPRCKKMFEKVRSLVCPKCQDDETADYDKIRAILDTDPDLNAEQVSVEADVDAMGQQITMALSAEASGEAKWEMAVSGEDE